MASMCMNYCDHEGFINDRYMAFVMARAVGGVGGLIIPGNPYGVVGPGRPAISDDRYIPGWEKLAEEVHKTGAKLICQLHPVGFEPRRVKDVNNAADYPKAFLEEMVEGFARAAVRCQAAGVDGVEIHGAHAHEIAVFTSPYTNKRTDEYGGDYTGRAKFGCDIIRAVKACVRQDYPLIYRMISDDKMPGGLRLAEAVKMAGLFEEAGADALHVSIGIYASEEYVSAPMEFEDCLLAEDAALIKANVHIPVIAVNRIVDLSDAEKIIEDDKADMVAMGRALLADPELVNKFTGKNDMPVRRCVGCNQGCRDTIRYTSSQCLQNPLLGREFEYPPLLARKDRQPPKVMIVGAGPGGLEAASVLAQNGLIPSVYEQAGDMGGLVNLSASSPLKQNMHSITDYRRKLLGRFGVQIHYNTVVDGELIQKEHPDVLILATGSKPFVPDILGLDNANVVTGDDVLAQGGVAGRKVAVIGGGLVGCEVAEFLKAQGKEVEVFEMKDKIAPEFYRWRQTLLVKRLTESGIVLRAEAQVVHIDLPRITVTENGARKEYDGFDAVVIAVGRKPERILADQAAGAADKVYEIGDLKSPSFVLGAIHDGFDAAMEILQK
ncbi:NADH oxidase [Synergistales bacterium]|nr:NADH oxidase [Synergistales bacterium]